MDDDENKQQGLNALGEETTDLALRFKALDYALAGLPRGPADGTEYLPDLAFDIFSFLKGTYDPDRFDEPVAVSGGTADVIDFSKFRKFKDHPEPDDDEPELPFDK